MPDVLAHNMGMMNLSRIPRRPQVSSGFAAAFALGLAMVATGVPGTGGLTAPSRLRRWTRAHCLRTTRFSLSQETQASAMVSRVHSSPLVT